MKPEAAKDDVANEFFDRFSPLSVESNRCPSISDLVSFVRDKKEFAHNKDHLSSCEHCKGLIELLSNSRQGESLHQFLAMTREEALRFAPDRPSSLFTYVRAFIANQPRWLVVPAAALALVFAFTTPLVRNLRQQQVQYAHDRSFSIGEDTYQKTILALMRDLEQSKLSQYDREQLQDKITEINKNLSELHGHMNGTQRAELAELINLYNSEVKEIKNEDKQFSQTPAMPSIARNSDAEKVGDLYKAIDEAIASGTTPKSEELPGANTATAVPPASQQIDIVAIEDQQIIVSDRQRSRPPEQQRAVEQGIRIFEARSKTRVAGFAPASPDH